MTTKLKASLLLSAIVGSAVCVAPAADASPLPASSTPAQLSEARNQPPPPPQRKRKLPKARQKEFLRSPQSRGRINVPRYLTAVANDADREWTRWLEQALGLQEPFVSLFLPGPTRKSPCGVVTTNTNNAFYCPAGEGEIDLPVNTFAMIWAGKLFGRTPKSTGDFAAAVVVAHEFGHHIQDEILKQFNAKGVRIPDFPPKDKNKELLADCFAGNWAFSAYFKGFVKPGDFDKAVDSLRAIGDPPGGGDHGSPDEREAAFRLGYNTGQPSACMVRYWSGATRVLGLG